MMRQCETRPQAISSQGFCENASMTTDYFCCVSDHLHHTALTTDKKDVYKH